jgi:hypothetical protein
MAFAAGCFCRAAGLLLLVQLDGSNPARAIKVVVKILVTHMQNKTARHAPIVFVKM